jgi:hypothetical protein
MRARVLAAAAALAAALGLSACDGPAQYSAITVKILAFPDGTAEMSWRVPAPATDAGTAGLRPPVRRSPRTSITGTRWATTPVRPKLTGLSTDRLDFEFAALMAVVEREWPEHLDSVFVSVCTPQANGSASGNGVDLTHYDSCAIFVSDSAATDAATDSRARLTFESRWHPATWLGLWLALVVVLGIGASELVHRSPARWNWVWKIIAAAAPGVSFLIVLRGADAASDWHTWDTGMEFDTDFGEPFRVVMLAGLIAAVALPLVYLTRRAMRRRRADALRSGQREP